MQVTKYPQSHLVVSNGTNTLVIDPGMITFAQGFKPEEFNQADAFLITHSHPDHIDPKTIKDVVKDKPVFGNADVVSQLQPLGISATEVKNREKFTVAGFEVKPVDLPHCKMQDGTDGPPNTGFLIDSVLFHPGDGFELENFTASNVALPIAGPTITLDGAAKFAQSLQAKIVIPIHYDYFKADPEEFKQKVSQLGIEVRPLKPGESTTI